LRINVYELYVHPADADIPQNAHFSPKMRLISPKNGSFFGSFYKISNTWFGLIFIKGHHLIRQALLL
jgi:hypothetical protein